MNRQVRWLQWSRSLRTAETFRIGFRARKKCVGFNGAAVLGLRRPNVILAAVVRTQWASMEPQS